MPQSPQSRPLDALAIAVTIGLCLTWGFNQVAIKLAIHDIPPLIQSAVRSAVAALCVASYARLRGIPLFKRDGTLKVGIIADRMLPIASVGWAKARARRHVKVKQTAHRSDYHIVCSRGKDGHVQGCAP